MKWPKYILIALALLLAIAVVLPFFITLDDYIPRIEQEASARLKQPVSIKSIRFSVLPLPHVTIKGISVGTSDDISFGTARVTPDFFSLLKSTRVIKGIEIDSLTLSQKGIDMIPVWIKSLDATLPQPTQPVRVERIRLKMVQLNFGKTRLGPFDARVSLDSKGEPQDISITSQDGKLKALIKPDQSDYSIDVSAKAWKLPADPAIVFDELLVKGVATFHDADLSQVSARLYGGTAKGKATISWQKGVQFKCNLDVNQVETQKIASMLSSRTHVSGKLRANPVLSASVASASQLINALRLETPFSVQNGVIHGVDIQKAATSLVKQGSTGGETRFEHLSGHLVMEHRAFHFTQLQISSGSLSVDGGNVNVSPQKELSGRINARVNALGTSAGVPLNVTGTLDSPLLYPTAGTLAGAAVGTAMLGPGVGTSVGAKVGGWVEGLFGKDEGEKPKK
jgi:uncharacterized protein involved in outer membrane biogenesis